MPFPGAMQAELLRHLTKKRATLLYPFEKLDLPEAYRGRWSHDMAKCTGCGLCAKDCPSEAIQLVETDITPGGRYPVCYLSRCMFCAQCQDTCPTGAIQLTNEYELADYQKRIIDSNVPEGFRYEKSK
ncbi:MAG: 4Fe-4S binding protein [Promethearchaeota archaeon]